MIHKWQVVENLLGANIVDALVATLYNQVADFAEIHKNYLSALENLKAELGEDLQRCVRKLAVAVDMKCSAYLFYFGMLGLKMNYDHFINPLLPDCTWPQFDFDDFLRVGIAYDMPMYDRADKYIDKLRKELGDGHEALWDAVLHYETELELCGSKLAHFYGYLMGNELLFHCVPCYQPDPALNLRYQALLKDYFGKPINASQWEGFFDLSKWKIAPEGMVVPEDAFVLREAIWKETLV